MTLSGFQCQILATGLSSVQMQVQFHFQVIDFLAAAGSNMFCLFAILFADTCLELIARMFPTHFHFPNDLVQRLCDGLKFLLCSLPCVSILTLVHPSFQKRIHSDGLRIPTGVVFCFEGEGECFAPHSHGSERAPRFFLWDHGIYPNTITFGQPFSTFCGENKKNQ